MITTTAPQRRSLCVHNKIWVWGSRLYIIICYVIDVLAPASVAPPRIYRACVIVEDSRCVFPLHSRPGNNILWVMLISFRKAILSSGFGSVSAFVKSTGKRGRRLILRFSSAPQTQRPQQTAARVNSGVCKERRKKPDALTLLSSIYLLSIVEMCCGLFSKIYIVNHNLPSK